MNYVAQEHEMGCGQAVLAMLLGISYKEVLDIIPYSEKGTRSWQLDTILAENNYATATLHRNAFGQRKGRVPWPCQPKADINYCGVKVFKSSPINHWVVLRGDGVVLDPDSCERTCLDDFHRVLTITAVMAVGKNETNEANK